MRREAVQKVLINQIPCGDGLAQQNLPKRPSNNSLSRGTLFIKKRKEVSLCLEQCILLTSAVPFLIYKLTTQQTLHNVRYVTLIRTLTHVSSLVVMAPPCTET